MKKIYSLVVETNGLKVPVNLTYYNPVLKTEELTKKVPLKVITDLTTSFNNKIELLDHLKSEYDIECNKRSKVKIMYVNNKKIRDLKVVYKNPYLNGIVLTPNKAVIKNTEKIDEVLNKVRHLYMNGFKSEVLSLVNDEKIRDYFIDYLHGFKSLELKKYLMDYRKYYDFIIGILDIDSNELKKEIVHEEEDIIRDYYVKNLDKILKIRA